MDRRQLVGDVTTAIISAAPATTPLIAAKGRSCNGLNLPVGGILSLPNGEIITLTAAATFKPVCTPVSPPAIIANGGGGSVSIDGIPEGVMPDEDGMTYSNFSDPFLASTFPQCYALAATTVVAYTLVIMLFITPRSFLDGGVLVLGQRGFTQSGSSGLSIGGRPWLQKVAALTVAISLTIATAATFSAAEEQYSYGIQNAKKLQKDVLEGNELKIIRIISNTFLWLAQAQTLIRLFPRQREKVIIKWTAFALISLDVIFQSLNSFKYQYSDSTIARPGAFNDAVPALSYLFTLALGVLYAAWVIYYSLMKKRYAYYHPQMKNMCLVATLSLLAILVPVVFFILDLAKSEFTGWGEYVRWVGAAAASVIVWEWVERIEALEREEKRDGILGREVFEGDEMLDVPPADGRLRRRRRGDGDGSGGEKEMRLKTGHDEKDTPDVGNINKNNRWPSAVMAIRAKYKPRSRPKNAERQPDPSNTQPSNHDRIRFLQPPLWPARPPPAVTPVSRTDSASAASTVYAVRYHPLTETTSHPTPPPLQQNSNSLALSRTDTTSTTRSSSDRSGHEREVPSQQDAPPTSPTSQLPSQPQPQSPPPAAPPQSRWHALTQTLPLKRTNKVTEPDEERAASSTASPPPPPQFPAVTGGDSSRPKWDIRERFEEFAATQAERLREKFRPTPDTGTLPVTVIPAPPRRGAALAQLLEEEEQQQFDTYHRGPPRTIMHMRGDDSSSTTLRVSRSGSSGESNSVMPPGTRLGVDPRAAGLPVLRVPAPPRADSTPTVAAAEPESRQSGIGRQPSEGGGGGGT
ncbi:pH-response regulator protein palH/prr-4 [Podospora fimiseda]|uniref:PH-response regulator protein palH/prr-4 n=1 Tax=Podospora fimiseda TaxID=252190 RepID=A0AAN7BLM4_9PEZI|nr:pH-response regulator protein palH/prr-4 [Podospora fimiseda]